uniref:TIR domain-containing protein n=1 Tax=Haptolina ericina TaxID=156174 RepID=A0A7S3AVW6_9EUKA
MAAREEMRLLSEALGVFSVLQSVKLDSDENIAAAVKFCDEKGAESVDDIVQNGFVDDFVSALRLKSIPARNLKAALQPLHSLASQLSHRGGGSGASTSTQALTKGSIDAFISSRPQLSARPIEPKLLLREGAPVTTEQANDLQQSLHAHLGSRSWDEWWPQVCISYATGTRPGVDARGAGPGMLQAAAIMQALHGAGIPCASGLHVPPGSNWKDFLIKIDSRFSRCEVLIVLLSSAFFRSHPCLLEVHKATQAKRMKIIPLRCEEPLPNKDEQWLDVGMQDARLLDEVQSQLGSINALPARGLFFDDEKYLKELVAQITKEVSRGTTPNVKAGARHKT